jgi:peptidoglycan/xylan/chitin deacetylase (PgdA/CDA1 family)
MPIATLPMWRAVPADIAHRIENRLDAALGKRSDPVFVFFRADDAAVPGTAFFRLTEIFAKHRMPLNLAVVPAWITAPRWQTLRQRTAEPTDLFCWHQHGWRHLNHEPVGKKQEFGPTRLRSRVAADLLRGRNRLEYLLGKHFYPVFTPPWNRCGSDTLARLHAMKYAAVSRNRGSRPKPPEGLMEIPVTVDLHTLRIGPPGAAWERLLSDLDLAVSGGVCGIMIHHRVMTDAAFGFLDMLLKTVTARRRLVPVTFRDLVEMERHK